MLAMSFPLQLPGACKKFIEVVDSDEAAQEQAAARPVSSNLPHSNRCVSSELGPIAEGFIGGNYTLEGAVAMADASLRSSAE